MLTSFTTQLNATKTEIWGLMMTKINLNKYEQYSGLGHFIKTDFVTKQLDIKDKKRLKQHNNNRQHKDKKQDDK